MDTPRLSLAAAVAASAACPSFLSPAEIHLNPSEFKSSGKEDLQSEPYTDTMVLTDGGVYDNLGLEPAWRNYKTVTLPFIPTPNVQTQIAKCRDVIASDASSKDKSYALVWLLHLVGDVHQPLHAMARIAAGESNDDKGG